MSKRAVKPSSTPAKEAETLVLFGVDENGKPRAARFPEDNAELVSKAARAMGLRLGIATTTEHFEVVKKLPVGRLYATGKGFVPNVRQDLYDKINALVGGEPGPISTKLPNSWGELAPGHLVIAQDLVADGWWEAVVTKRQDDMLTLKWRDYPSQAEFVRHAKAVALLNDEQT